MPLQIVGELGPLDTKLFIRGRFLAVSFDMPSNCGFKFFGQTLLCRLVVVLNGAGAFGWAVNEENQVPVPSAGR